MGGVVAGGRTDGGCPLAPYEGVVAASVFGRADRDAAAVARVSLPLDKAFVFKPAQCLSTQVRCPGSRAFHQRCMPIPSGATTWESDPSSSPTSPTRSTTTPATVTPSQSGHHREAIRAPPSSAKSQCGAPPTASIPKTHDQPEKTSSRQPPPCGNNASTGKSPVPPIRQATPGPRSDRQHTPHLVAGTTASAHTKRPVSVRPGQPHPAANPPPSWCAGACGCPMQSWHVAMAAD
jgi:hypothetical protein